MEEVVIQNTFKIFGSKNKVAELTLDGRSIVVIADREKKPKVIKVDMLLRILVKNFHRDTGRRRRKQQQQQHEQQQHEQQQDQQPEEEQKVLEIHYVNRPDNESGGNVNSWRLGSLQLCHRDTKVLTSWKAVLNRKMEDSATVRPKTLLLFVNPHGGRGRAQQVYREQVEPVFSAAGIECTVVITQSADHAGRYIGEYDGDMGDRYDGVVSVGGDGMFNQICDAIVRRANGGSIEAGRDLSAPKMRLGVIPAGSTDAVAYTLHGTARADSAALHVALGDTTMVDGLAVSVDGTVKCLSLTIASRGFFGDNLAWSERLRFLGPSRYEAAGVVNFLANRSFRGTVTMLKAEPSLDPCAPIVCSSVCECGEVPGEVIADKTSLAKEEISGKFLMVIGACISCSCTRTPRGLSPNAHLGDGRMDLIILKKASRRRLLKFLLRVGSKQGRSALELSEVEARRIVEFTFAEETKRSKKNTSNFKKGIPWNCDGELLWVSTSQSPPPPITVAVCRKLVPVFARGPTLSNVSKVKMARSNPAFSI